MKKAKNTDVRKNEIFEIVQKFLKDPPVVIWGSGATIDYGMPSMNGLSEKLSLEGFDVRGKNLEEELGRAKYTKKLPEIRRIIWETVKEVDEKVISDLLKNPDKYRSIQKLVERCLDAHPRVMNIVTTNYDRVIEYVLSYYKIAYTDGFLGQTLSSFDENLFKSEDIVNIIKVHGSLNWGKYNDEVRYLDRVNETNQLIIPPGKNKYREAYNSPYRELIQVSDKKIKSANSFLVVGFGFNDEHITPRITGKVRDGIPIVLITKQVTKTTKDALAGAKNYILLEEDGRNKTNATGAICNDGDKSTVIDGQYWKLDNFMEDVW